MPSHKSHTQTHRFEAQLANPQLSYHLRQQMLQSLRLDRIKTDNVELLEALLSQQEHVRIPNSSHSGNLHLQNASLEDCIGEGSDFGLRYILPELAGLVSQPTASVAERS